MNDLIFITHCCLTSHKSLQMEITADNINVSSDGPQTLFLCVLNAGKQDNEVTTPFCRTSQKKKKKKKTNVETIINSGSGFANFRFSLEALVFHLLYKRYTIAKQSLSIR